MQIEVVDTRNNDVGPTKWRKQKKGVETMTFATRLRAFVYVSYINTASLLYKRGPNPASWFTKRLALHQGRLNTDILTITMKIVVTNTTKSLTEQARMS